MTAMGTRSALVAHVNKWPLSAVPIWPLNGKDGRKAAGTIPDWSYPNRHDPRISGRSFEERETA
jgi:hypothetical protein